MQYRLIMQTMSSGVAWEHNFDIASDKMAKEYVSRQLAQPHNIPASFMGAELFRIEPEGYIASFAVRVASTVIERL